MDEDVQTEQPAQNVSAYVADMSAQLAALCRDHLPVVARLLDIAAEIAGAPRP